MIGRNNPYVNQRGRGNAARNRAAGGNGGGGGKGDGEDNRPNHISGKERDFWETRNWDTYWNSELSQFGGESGDFAEWWKNVYGKQVYDKFQNEINQKGDHVGVDKWGKYVRRLLEDKDAVMTEFNRYYTNNNMDNATSNWFVKNGLTSAGNSTSAFGNWLNNKMGAQLQQEYSQRDNKGLDYYDWLDAQEKAGVFNTYYDQYMQDPSRVAPSFGTARWQAF